MKIAALAVAALVVVAAVVIVLMLVASANAPSCVCGDPECGGGCLED